MDADFTITVDRDHSLMHATLAGFFQPADVARFAAVRAATHAQLRSPPNRHLTLVDIRDMKIQSGETVAAFAELLADPRFHARRIAFVVGPGLTRSQLGRAASGRGAGIFADPADARHWLLADPVADAAA